MRRSKKANDVVIATYSVKLQNLGKIIYLFIAFFFTEWAQASDKVTTFEKYENSTSYEIKSGEENNALPGATALSTSTVNMIPVSNGSYRITFLIKNFPKSLFTNPVTVKVENKVVIDDLRNYVLPNSSPSFKLIRQVKVADGRLDIEYINKTVEVQMGLVIKKMDVNTAPPAPVVSGKEVWKINFNGDQADQASGWNNFNSLPVANQMLSQLTNSSNKATEVNVKLATDWDSHNNKAFDSGNNVGLYPDAVMRSYFYTSDQERLRIGGLDPNQQYSFTFFASSPHNETRNTAFSIGNQKVELEASLNESNTVSLKDIKPDDSGYIYLYVGKGTGSEWGILNALTIESSGTVVSARISSQKHKTQADNDRVPEMEESIPFTKLNVYPNPAREVLYVETGSDIRYFLYNMQGNLLKTGNVAGSLETQEIMVYDLQPGMYLIRFDTESGTTTKKIIIKP